MLLNYQAYGEASDQSDLVIVHGLFGAGRNWRAIAKHLSTARRVITVDLRNHGDSFWDDDNSYVALAIDLAKVIEHLGGPVDLLGHSMGGKAGMILAFDRPELINRLVVADIAPIAYRHSQISNIEVMQSVPLDAITRRSEADVIMADKIDDPMVRAFLLQSLNIDASGNTWSLNLDALAKNMPAIVGFPDTDGVFDGDTVFVRGGNSDYIDAVSEPLIATHFPNSNIVTIPNAGHWVHAEAPREFMTLIKDYLGAT